MKETKWTAIYMPATDRDDPTKSGFATENEAWEYAESRYCKMCREAMKEGKTWMVSCSAEWDVCTDEEWNSYKEEDENN